jgi:hypothetical protein
MAAYFPDARETSYEKLISSMTNHPKDRHVLAAAVAGRADVLVTENLKDFPPAAVAHLGSPLPAKTTSCRDCSSCTRMRCWTRSAGRHPVTAANREAPWRC